MNKPYDNSINLLMGIADKTINPFTMGLNPNGVKQSVYQYPSFRRDAKSDGISSADWLYQTFEYYSADPNPIIGPYVYKYANSDIITTRITSKNGNVSLKNIPSGYVGVLRGRFYNSFGGSFRVDPDWSAPFAMYLNSKLVKLKYNESDIQRIEVSMSAGWNDIDFYLYSNTDENEFRLNLSADDFAEIWEAGGNEKALPPRGITIRLNNELLSPRESNSIVVDWETTDHPNTESFSVYRKGPITTGFEIPEISVALSSGIYVSGVDGVYSKYYDITKRNGEVVSVDLNFVRDSYYYSVAAVYSGFETEPSSAIKLTPSDMLYNHTFDDAYSYPDDSGMLPLDTQYTYFVVGSTSYVDILPVGEKVISLTTSEYSTYLSWTPAPGIHYYKILRASGVVDVDYFLNGSGHLIDTVYKNIEYIDSGVYSGISTYNSFTFPSGFSTTRNSIYYGLSPLDKAINSGLSYGTNGFDIRWTFSNSGQQPDYFKLYRSVRSGIYETDSLIAVIPAVVSGSIVSGYIDSESASPSGVTTTSVPKVFLKIATVNKNNTSYIDSNLKTNGIYEYAIAARNYNGLEGDLSDSVFINAGDKTPPATPVSGVAIGVDSSIKLTWINGGEDDYYQTYIYNSAVSSGTFTKLVEVRGETAYIPVGYNNTSYYKLANIDFNGNLSSLSSVITGVTLAGASGTFDSGVLTGYVSKSGDTMYGDLIISGSAALRTTSIQSLAGGVSPSINIVSNSGIDMFYQASHIYMSGISTRIGVNNQITYIKLHDDDGIEINASNSIGSISLYNNTASGVISLENIISGVPSKIQLGRSGQINTSGDIVPFNSGAYDLGSSGYSFRRLYVDEIISTGVSGSYVSKAGDTMSGWLTFTSGNGIYSSEDFSITSNGPGHVISVLSSSGITLGGGAGTIGISTAGDINIGCNNLITIGCPNTIDISSNDGVTISSAASGVSVSAGTDILIDSAGGSVLVDSSTGVSINAAGGSLIASGVGVDLEFSTSFLANCYSDGGNGAQIGLLSSEEAWIAGDQAHYLSISSGYGTELRHGVYQWIRMDGATIALNADSSVIGSGFVFSSSGLDAAAHIRPEFSGIYDLGSSSLHYRTLYVDNISGVQLGTTYSGVAPIQVNGSEISIRYKWNEIPSGTIDGSNKNFTVLTTPVGPSGVQLYQNGLYMAPSGIGAPYFDYVLSGSTFLFTVAPPSGSILIANYQY